MNDVRRSTWAYATARASAVVADRLCVIRVSGIVTNEIGRQLLADNAQWLADTGALGQVADYRDSVVAMDADALLGALVRAKQVDEALARPTALLVRSEQLALFEPYVSLSARIGVCRAPFTGDEAARAWAQSQAPAFAALQQAVERARWRDGGTRPAAPCRPATFSGHRAAGQTPRPAPGPAG